MVLYKNRNIYSEAAAFLQTADYVYSKLQGFQNYVTRSTYYPQGPTVDATHELHKLGV